MEETITVDKIKKVAQELLKSNSENDNYDDMTKNPYACGVHDGILDVIAGLGITIKDEDWIN